MTGGLFDFVLSDGEWAAKRCASCDRLLPTSGACAFCAGFRADGETYDPKKDKARLSGQLQAVWDAMINGGWRTLAEILEQIGSGSEAAVSARLRDLRKARFGAHRVERRRRATGLWEYRLTINQEQTQ